ncbi:putative ribonuclease H-like domain-containing protein [Tanacetum coccineum]
MKVSLLLVLLMMKESLMNIERASDPDKKRKFVKEDVLTKVPAKPDVAEQGTKKRKGGHMKMLARKRKRPQPDVDILARLNKVSSPDGDYLVIYRANGNFRVFNYLMEIVRWRLYEACGVYILELEDGTIIHMLVERRYPLSKELLQRMLDFGLEVEHYVKRPQPDVDSDDEHRKCLKIVTFEGTIDSEIMERKSVIARLNKVSSPDGDYLVVYRVNGNFRAFNYLLEVLHIFDRQDLFHLYDLVMNQYSEVTLEGIKLILWGDLKIMLESSTEENDQKLEDGTVIHMLVERRYPLSKDLLQRMLDLGLEVKEESTAALHLLTIPEQTATGKGISNPLMAGSLPKTAKPTLLDVAVVLVIKPHNKTPYELFLGRKPALSFMRPFGCPVTILNTLDHLVVLGNQTNGNASTKENIDVGQDGKKLVPDQKYILLPLLTSDPLLSKISKDSPETGFKLSGEEEKIDFEHPENEDSDVPNIEESRINQEQDANVNSTNNINTVSPTVNVADIENNDVDENIVYGCIDDPNMHNLEEIVYSDDDEEVGADADMNNLATTVLFSPILTIRVHKDHPLEQIIGDIQSALQTRRMTKNMTKHEEPKKVTQALTYPSWIKAMQDELLQFKLQKKDDRGIVVRSKARLVAQGYTQEDGIYYDEVFAPVARIEAIRLFLAYASFMNFIVYQTDVKSAFLYGTIEEEVYVCQPPGFEDPEFPNNVYKVKQKDDGIFISQDKYVADILKKFDFATVRKASTPMDTNKALLKDEEAVDVDVHLYRSVIRSLTYLTAFRPDIMFVVYACARDSPFDLKAFSDNGYAGASLDRKSTTGEEYVAGANCCEQTVIKEWEDRMERAATTASSLVAEQDSGNINRTQSMATLNEPFPRGTDLGSGPRCQDTILRGAEAQIRFEVASKQSNDLPLLRVNTLRSREDSMKLKELMEFCTNISVRALDL